MLTLSGPRHIPLGRGGVGKGLRGTTYDRETREHWMRMNRLVTGGKTRIEPNRTSRKQRGEKAASLEARVSGGVRGLESKSRNEPGAATLRAEKSVQETAKKREGERVKERRQPTKRKRNRKRPGR